MLHLLQMALSKLLTSLSPNSELMAALTLGAAPLLVALWFPLGLLWFVYLHCTIWPPLLLMFHFCSTLVFISFIQLLPIWYPLPLPPHHHSLLSFYAHASSPPDSLRILQWNAGGLQASSTELLYFLSYHPVDLFCIQESNLNSSSPFRISALRSDCIHSRSGILSHDATHASGVAIIFVRQGLSFFKFSTTFLLRLTPTLIM